MIIIWKCQQKKSANYGVDHSQDEVGHFLLGMIGKASPGHVIVKESVDENGRFDVDWCTLTGTGALLALASSGPPNFLRFRLPADALDQVQRVVEHSVRRGSFLTPWLPWLHTQELFIRQCDDASLLFNRNSIIYKFLINFFFNSLIIFF